MLERSLGERLRWIAMSLVPTLVFPFVFVSGVSDDALWVWFVLAVLYLLILGALYHRYDHRRRHASAVFFAVLGCMLNGFVLVVTAVTLVVGLDIGFMGSMR